MRLVVDASVALAWSLPDEGSEEADRILSEVEMHGAVAPSLFKIEIANVLAQATRQNRISTEVRATALEALSELGFIFDTEGLEKIWSDVIDIADQHQLSVYDALYLEVAVRRGLKLATFDAKLRRAASAAGVSLALAGAQ